MPRACIEWYNESTETPLIPECRGPNRTRRRDVETYILMGCFVVFFAIIFIGTFFMIAAEERVHIAREQQNAKDHGHG